MPLLEDLILLYYFSSFARLGVQYAFVSDSLPRILHQAYDSSCVGPGGRSDLEQTGKRVYVVIDDGASSDAATIF